MLPAIESLGFSWSRRGLGKLRVVGFRGGPAGAVGFDVLAVQIGECGTLAARFERVVRHVPCLPTEPIDLVSIAWPEIDAWCLDTFPAFTQESGQSVPVALADIFLRFVNVPLRVEELRKIGDLPAPVTVVFVRVRDVSGFDDEPSHKIEDALRLGVVCGRVDDYGTFHAVRLPLLGKEVAPVLERFFLSAGSVARTLEERRIAAGEYDHYPLIPKSVLIMFGVALCALAYLIL